MYDLYVCDKTLHNAVLLRRGSGEFVIFTWSVIKQMFVPPPSRFLAAASFVIHNNCIIIIIKVRDQFRFFSPRGRFTVLIGNLIGTIIRFRACVLASAAAGAGASTKTARLGGAKRVESRRPFQAEKNPPIRRSSSSAPPPPPPSSSLSHTIFFPSLHPQHP